MRASNTLAPLTAELHAVRMADIFGKHAAYIAEDDEDRITEEGLFALAGYFNDVPYELRGATYEWFIHEMNERGYKYDVVDFGGQA